MEEIKTLKDHVYSYIAQQIRTGTLLPNQKISEGTICENLKISRTPVREALIQLTAEGVLENLSRKGFVIKAISEKDVVEIYGVIGVLDGYAAKTACDRLDNQDLANLEFYVDAIDLAIKAGNSEMYHSQQHNFHQLYIDKCGNSALIEEIAKMQNKLLKKGAIDIHDQATKDILYKTNREHREILRLFKLKAKDELFKYLSETHWTANYAEYDAKASIATAELGK